MSAGTRGIGWRMPGVVVERSWDHWEVCASGIGLRCRCFEVSMYCCMKKASFAYLHCDR